MSEDKTGGPAFPLPYECYTDNAIPGNTELFGMTLRDYFAANALHGMFASDVRATQQQFAKYAYIMADAMLEARKSTNVFE